MAAKRSAKNAVDYQQLNSISSVVLYDTTYTRRQSSRFYEAERIIERQKKGKVSGFLNTKYKEMQRITYDYDTHTDTAFTLTLSCVLFLVDVV